MTHPHVVVWLDHREARIIDYSPDDVHQVHVHARNGQRALHHKAGAVGSGHAKDDHHYFDEIVTAIGNAAEVLIVGPGTAKTAFHKDLQHRHGQMSTRVVGVESLDHPSDNQLLAYAKKYFKRVDALRGDG